MVKRHQSIVRWGRNRIRPVKVKPKDKRVAPKPIPPSPVKVEPIIINTEWKLSVPKILHAYWGGDMLPYIRYMTIVSFMRLNPDWQVILWRPSHLHGDKIWLSREHSYAPNCTNYLNELLKLPIEIKYVDFEDLGLSNDMAEVHKSDFLRTYLLSTMGGVWTDMDILYLNPITHLKVNREHNRYVETFVCLCSYGHSTGFMMACQNNAFFAEMDRHTGDEYSPEQYQCIGPELYNKYGGSLCVISQYASVANIDMEAVYAHDAHHIQELWSNVPTRFTPNSVGVHWYAGHYKWGNFINQTDGGRVNLPNTIIGNVLRKLNSTI